MNQNFANILWVGFGGFIGSVARYGTSKLFQYFELTTFPYSTLTVNIIGSFLLGFMSETFFSLRTVNPGIALFLTVGVCGGFTTFSTFTFENIMLLRDGQHLIALFYTLSSFVCALLAFVIGISIAKYIF